MSLLTTTTVFALVAIVFISSTAAQTCYYPSGLESGHVACSSPGSEASCCGASQVCMSNGLCFGDGIMSRGSCTDKDWDSEECSQFCSEGTYIYTLSKPTILTTAPISLPQHQHSPHSMHKRQLRNDLHLRPKPLKLQEQKQDLHPPLRRHNPPSLRHRKPRRTRRKQRRKQRPSSNHNPSRHPNPHNRNRNTPPRCDLHSSPNGRPWSRPLHPPPPSLQLRPPPLATRSSPHP